MLEDMRGRDGMDLPILAGLADDSPDVGVDVPGPLEPTPERMEAQAFFLRCVERARSEPDGILSIKVLLTPELAHVVLLTNRSNRKMIPSQVSKYARDIAGGHWEFNGEAIVISIEGLLNTGQHRCFAVVEAGTAVWTMMTFGIERVTRASVDQGSMVGTGQALGMLDLRDGNHLAAVANGVVQYRRIGSVTTRKDEQATRSELVATIMQNPDIAECLDLVGVKGVPLVGGKTTFALALWILSRCNPRDEVLDFLLSFANGAVGDDPKAARVFCLNRLTRKKDKSMRLVSVKVELLMRTWAAHRQGRTNVALMAIRNELPPIHGDLVDHGAGKPAYG